MESISTFYSLAMICEHKKLFKNFSHGSLIHEPFPTIKRTARGKRTGAQRARTFKIWKLVLLFTLAFRKPNFGCWSETQQRYSGQDSIFLLYQDLKRQVFRDAAVASRPTAEARGLSVILNTQRHFY